MWSLPTEKLLSSSNHVSISDLRLQVSQRETDLKRELLALRTFRSTLAPINRLPPELLSIIFLLLSRITRTEFNGRYALTWVQNVTQVCRRWRDVATSCPELWVVFNEVLASPAVTDAALAWSRNMPLRVEYDSVDPDSGWKRPALARATLYRLLETQAYRICSITIVNSRIDLHRALETLGKDAPMLKELLIDAKHVKLLPSDRFVPSMRYAPSATSVVPSRFLQSGRGAPALERLSLTGCRVLKWEDLPLQGGKLKSLKLLEPFHYTNSYREPNQRPTVQEFFTSLSQMPLLEELHLARYLPLEGYTNIPSSLKSVACNRLRSITLLDFADVILSFCMEVKARCLETLRLRLEDVEDEYQLRVDILPALSSLRGDRPLSLCPHELFIFPDLSPTGGYGTDFRLVFPEEKQRSPSSQNQQTPTGDGTLTLEMSFEETGESPIDVLESLEDTMDLSELRHLSFDRHSCPVDTITSKFWWEAVGKLQNLQHITALGDVGWDLLQMLQELGDGSKEVDGRPDTRFSGLSCITIEESPKFDQEKLRLLVDAISMLGKRVQHPLKLRFIGCDGFTKTQYEWVKEALPDVCVEWDRLLL